MVLMKDIKVDPEDLVTPELIEEITEKIMSSMGNVNFMQVGYHATMSSFRVPDNIATAFLVKRASILIWNNGNELTDLFLNYENSNISVPGY